MSRAALEVERQVKAMKAEAAKGRKAPNTATRGDKTVNDSANKENQLTENTSHDMTDGTNLSDRAGSAEGGNIASSAADTANGRDTNVAKKNGNGGAAKKAKGAKKAAKTPRAAKAAGERKSRVKTVSGELKKVEPMGGTYLKLEFEEGHIVLTPTSNREANRDIAVKALRSAIK